MAAGYLALDDLYLEHRVRRLQHAHERREMRETYSPFDLHDDSFIDKYRLTPDLAQSLVDDLEPYLQRDRSYWLTTEHQVLTALEFYATGSYQRSVGDTYTSSMSQPSVSRCIRAVTECINQHLFRQWVTFPMTPDERHTARQLFRAAPQPFEGAIGALDCTYVNILAPREHEEAYVNHWGDHYLNVQAICYPNLRITNVNARFPGSRHDFYIWNQSPARRVMERNYNNGERHTWIIADDGYFVEPWLMTPLKNEVEGTPRYRYNEALCSARNCVERLFGVWKSQFRCLSSQRKLMYEPDMAGKIVNACAVLHNMLVNNELIEAIEEPQAQAGHALEDSGSDSDNEALPAQRRAGRAVAERIRAQLIARYFTH